MSNKALGRDLGDLLSRARPAKLVERVRGGPEASVAAAVPEPVPQAPTPEPAAAPEPPPAPARYRPSIYVRPAAPSPNPVVPDAVTSRRWPRRVICLTLDLGLLAGMILLVRSEALSPAWTVAAGAAAMTAGSALAILAFVPPRPPRPAAEPPSRIRVQLKR